MANVESDFGGRLDVLFTHDAPPALRGIRSQILDILHHIELEAEEVRRLIGKAVERTQVERVAHGSQGEVAACGCQRHHRAKTSCAQTA